MAIKKTRSSAVKPKLAVYWAAGCGGCDDSLLASSKQMADLTARFDIVLWPLLFDGKGKDVKALGEREIALTIFSGSLRTSADLEMTRLLRAKSARLLAYGACASWGGIPGLANLGASADLLRTIYLESPATVNPRTTLPLALTEAPEGRLSLPALNQGARRLDQAVAVDYLVPGCPPEQGAVEQMLDWILSVEFPASPIAQHPAGPVVVAGGDKTLCEECPREQRVFKIKKFCRAHEIIPDPAICLLAQGLVCLGPVTRGGCGARCPGYNMACLGCYGPAPGLEDAGGRMLSALGSILDVPHQGRTEAEIKKDIEAALTAIVDPAGLLYKFDSARL